MKKQNGLSVIVGVGLLLGASTQAYAMEIFKVNSGGTAVITLTNADDTLTLSPASEYSEILPTIVGGEFSCAPMTILYQHNENEPGMLMGVRKLTVNARGGANVITINDLTLEKDLRVVTGSGMDTIAMNSNRFCGRLTVVSGTGEDALTINDVGVDKQVSLNTGGGDDDVDLYNLMVGSTFQLVTGSGDDTVAIEQGMSEESLTMLNGRANIVTSSGDDSVTLNNIKVSRQMGLVTGSGMDTVVLNENQFMNSLNVNTGADDDDVTVTGNMSANRTLFNGSGGRGDVYRYDENNIFGSPFVMRGFESEELVEVPMVYAIGDTGPGGGIVFSVNEDGTSGLEAATADLPDLYTWDAAITAASNYAEPLGALDQWFLPNKTQLDMIYRQAGVVGDLADGHYWSSSSYSIKAAWSQRGSNGNQTTYFKYIMHRVRAVRAF